MDVGTIPRLQSPGRIHRDTQNHHLSGLANLYSQLRFSELTRIVNLCVPRKWLLVQEMHCSSAVVHRSYKPVFPPAACCCRGGRSSAREGDRAWVQGAGAKQGCDPSRLIRTNQEWHTFGGLLQRTEEFFQIRLPQRHIEVVKLSVAFLTGWHDHILTILHTRHLPFKDAKGGRVYLIVSEKNQQ